MADQDRPTKRIKIDASSAHTVANVKNESTPAQAVSTSLSEDPVGEDQATPGNPSSSKRRGKGQRPNTNGANKTHHQTSIRTFSQPSVLCAGDRGIFVTSDKGCEKKALLEIHDILQEHLNSLGVDASGQSVTKRSSGEATADLENDKTGLGSQRSIEADIASELAAMRDEDQTSTSSAPTSTTKPMQLITLDMPCVSFVRFPPKSLLDPVGITHDVCSQAANPQGQQRSRFVKRLTPVSSIAKTLKQGLEKVCEDILPLHFGPNSAGAITSVKYAIRPTIRENEQLDRDSVIRMVADRVQEIGKTSHKVDLKGYEKGVIVEVYRGWVGMSVVDNTNTGGYKHGFEQLKRFNLAEVYAKR